MPSNYASAAARVRRAETPDDIARMEKSLMRLYNAGQLSVSEYSRLGVLLMEQEAKKRNPRMATRKATRTKGAGKGSRWGVYVKSQLAYVSTNKLDANKAATKLKASGRAFITIKAVNPNPITGKLPKIGWRDQFKKAAYAAMKTPKARRKMASRDTRTRQTRERRGKNPRKSNPVLKGWAAIEFAERYGRRTVSKHADAVSGARKYLSLDEAREVAREDPGLIYLNAGPSVRKAARRVSRSRNAASILMRRSANPKTTKKRSTTPAQRERYMVQVGDTPAWVGRLKSDADKAWGKLTDAGHKAVKIFKVKVNRVVKDGWRKAFKGSSTRSTGRKRNPVTTFKSLSVGSVFEFDRTGVPLFSGMARGPWIKTGARTYRALDGRYGGGNIRVGSINAKVVKENPSFPGRLGSGSRFRACVTKMSRQPGVYDPEGLCASIGRKKYGKKGMAKLASKGRKKNPGYSYFVKAANEKAIYSLGGVKINRAIAEASALARRKGADVTLYRGKWKEDGTVGKKVRVRLVKLVD